jgi:hypothetical protein
MGDFSPIIFLNLPNQILVNNVALHWYDNFVSDVYVDIHIIDLCSLNYAKAPLSYGLPLDRLRIYDMYL